MLAALVGVTKVGREVSIQKRWILKTIYPTTLSSLNSLRSILLIIIYLLGQRLEVGKKRHLLILDFAKPGPIKEALTYECPFPSCPVLS